jgi:hypothetical protein
MSRLGIVLMLCLAGVAGAASLPAADRLSDAPETSPRPRPAIDAAGSYAEALQRWPSAEALNDWIGAHFRYDMARALRLSETQRQRSGGLPIHEPADFFDDPTGVCVDLARFAVESLQRIDPGARARYLMIEFEPLSIAGNSLRRHWLVSFEREGRWYFFADSKRPGPLAGPYRTVDDFIADYARYRGREIVAFRQADSYQRRQRSMAVRTPGGPPP